VRDLILRSSFFYYFIFVKNINSQCLKTKCSGKYFLHRKMKKVRNEYYYETNFSIIIVTQMEEINS